MEGVFSSKKIDTWRDGCVNELNDRTLLNVYMYWIAMLHTLNILPSFYQLQLSKPGKKMKRGPSPKRM